VLDRAGGVSRCPLPPRRLQSQGHTVRLLPPQYVRPYVKSHKNDFVDAEAIAEAVGRATMRFVPLKTVAQLDLQALHRVRDRLVMRRTGLINQIRAFLLEQGLPLRSGRRVLQRELPMILANEETPISARLRQLLSGLWEEWRGLETQLTGVTATIEAVASEDEACQRLLDVPGVGPLTATALVAAIGTGEAFRKGRDFASWLGLVPRQHSTGQISAAWTQQARQQSSPSPLRARRTFRCPARRSRTAWLRRLAHSTSGALASERRHGRTGQQARADRLGRAPAWDPLPSEASRRCIARPDPPTSTA